MSDDDPLRLALASYYLPSDSKIGAGWMSHRLANALVDLGHDVTMFSPAPECADARYSHRQVALPGRLRTVRWPWVLRGIDLNNFDGLLAQGDDHLIKRGAVPAHIRTMHGSCFDEARFVPRPREKARMLFLGVTELVAAIRTPEVVGVSRASLRYFPWRHRVIPNGVDIELFRPGDDDIKEERPTVLFVGTYRRRKRGQLLQEVFETYVLPRVPNAQLWMVCTDSPGGASVEVLGHLTDEDLADRYRRAWVFCLPSTYEGFGVPYIEAMVSGTAIVGSRNLGAREVLENGERGVLARDSELGWQLVRLLVDDDERRRLERLGLERRDHYDFHRIAEQYVGLVRTQLKTKSHG